jgi:hypothetical protein
MLVVWIDRRIRFEFTVDPLGNENLQFGGIVPPSSVSPLPKLKKKFSKAKAIIDIVKIDHL